MSTQNMPQVQFAIPYALYDDDDGQNYQLLHVPRRPCQMSCVGNMPRHAEAGMEYFYMHLPVDDSDHLLTLAEFINKHRAQFDEHVPLAQVTRVTGWNHYDEHDEVYDNSLEMPVMTMLQLCDHVTFFLEMDSLAVFARYHS